MTVAAERHEIVFIVIIDLAPIKKLGERRKTLRPKEKFNKLQRAKSDTVLVEEA